MLVQTVALVADPAFVAYRGSSIMTWNTPDASSCNVTANGFNLWTGTSGNVNTSLYGPLLKDTVYELTCAMKAGPAQRAAATVLVPLQPPSADFSYARMRGANIFDGDFWFSNAKNIVGAAGEMNVNFMRINMNIWQALMNASVPYFMQVLNETMAAASNHSFNVILVFGGYVEHDNRCGSYGSFLDVQPVAQQIVAKFGQHPSLYAFELMNEAYSTMGDGLKCDKPSIRQAVTAMYRLVRKGAPGSLTSVSEAWFWWYLPNWADVSSFSSFHIYPPVLSPVNASQLELAQELMAKNIDDARAAVMPLPLVLGEFGAASLTDSDQAWFYRALYAQLKDKGIGSFFWDLSVSDVSFRVLYANGTFKPAAIAIAAALHAALDRR